jgi:hypothetical protein
MFESVFGLHYGYPHIFIELKFVVNIKGLT